eukprot:6190559-Pleurochrysis_carterae.AAC.1
MRDAPEPRVAPQPFVGGLAYFVPTARGCVWDLRGPAVIMPLNFRVGPASPLNAPYITSSLPQWPDARKLSYPTHGVRSEVDLPLQIVRFLNPFFISFS